MEDLHLKALAAITSLVGLLIIWSMAAAFEVESVAIGDLTSEDVGRLVMVCGEVDEIREYEVYMSFELRNGSSIKVFGRKSFFQNLTEGDFVEVKGDVQEYLDFLEVVPQRKEDVRKINKQKN